MYADPHQNEYLAATAGMSDVYGYGPHAIGDRVTYRLRSWGDGSYEAGRVTGFTVCQQGRERLVVKAEDDGTIRILDPQPWPTGNLLPF
jgi:hypothetical protein